MKSTVAKAFAPLLFLAAFPANAEIADAPVVEEDLRRHIEILASDEYEGREPGTRAEPKTLIYIGSRLASFGFEPAAPGGSWYQPVPLISRTPFAQRAAWKVGGETHYLDLDELVLIGAGPVESLLDAPVRFVGYGLPDEIAGRDLAGAVAILYYELSGEEEGPTFTQRKEALIAAGAAAVIAIMPDEVPEPTLMRLRWADGESIDGKAKFPRVMGAMRLAAARRLLGIGPTPGRTRLRSARVSIEVSTVVRRYTSHNLVARLKGNGSTGETVLLLGHWDHLGICRPVGAADRICNGAVDNASGIAAMIEIASRLAKGPRPARDILFLATTAEEKGLFGAEYFAANPVVPLQSIVGAINVDTIAVHPRGMPVAVIGGGHAPLDAVIERTVGEVGRSLDRDNEAFAYRRRQDGWELSAVGVPTVMIGGAFSDMNYLNAFLETDYHGPGDDLRRPLILGGAVEDTELMLRLIRKMADPALYSGRR